MTFSARDRKRATAATANMNVKRLERRNDLKVRNAGKYVCHPGKRYPSASKGLQPEEKRRLKGIERIEENRRQRRRSWGASGGRSGRRWNTNMRIKAVEGIKAYNHGADLFGLRLCLRVYTHPSIPLYFGLFVRSSTDLGRSVDGCECGFIWLQMSAKFLK